ncbi:MAG TPA: peptidylprolyl isomerase [Chiayiivirga sp.]|nr:peptidylprolyl isomerase [Chiayiivirga sp.]
MKTTSGPIVVELFPDKAPATVANFLRYVDAKKLDGSSFYRAVRLDNQRSGEIPIEVVQGGQYGHELVGGKAMQTFEPVAHETTTSSGLLHRHGAISMARAAPGSATSEFFISIHDNPALDAGGKRNPDGQGFAVFGQVRRGMETVEGIQKAATGKSQEMDLGPMRGQLLDQQVAIESVRRVCAPNAAKP